MKFNPPRFRTSATGWQAAWAEHCNRRRPFNGLLRRSDEALRSPDRAIRTGLRASRTTRRKRACVLTFGNLPSPKTVPAHEPLRVAVASLRPVCFLHYTGRSEEHTSELQSRENLVCRLLLEKKKNASDIPTHHTN